MTVFIQGTTLSCDQCDVRETWDDRLPTLSEMMRFRDEHEHEREHDAG